MEEKTINYESTKWNNKQIMSYLEENNDVAEEFYSILYDKGADQNATVGFSNREHQAKYYFNNKHNRLDTYDYPKKVNLVYDLFSLIRRDNSNEDELKKFISILKKHGYEDGCSLVWVDDDNGDEFYFHSDKEDAEIQFDYLKGSEEPFIEDEIDKFKTSIKETLNFEIQVEVKEEFRDPFYTYNIYDNDVLIVDGTYNLDEGAKADVINYIEFKNYLESQNLYLDSIEKQIDGFTRYYIVSIGMYGKYDTIDIDIPMDGNAFVKGYYQGVKRSLVNVFKDFVDMDDLMQQFKNMD
ncbi:hypothetical protein [Holdemanella porci]|uniref:hypothetical protein n=1 Tax=Holdemanella porci TaxID=2652276 RepID=UPI00388D455D